MHDGHDQGGLSSEGRLTDRDRPGSAQALTDRPTRAYEASAAILRADAVLPALHHLGGFAGPANGIAVSVNGTTAVTLDDDTVIVDLRPETRRIFLEPGTGLLGANRAERIFKRAIDLLGAVVALVALSPVMLIAAIAVKLSSPGPVLYICDRVGEGGRHFRFMKFRTMVCDADERRKDLADANRHAGSPIFKVVDDPRVTTVGAALRRWSIDEMPQLFHVLSGKMSLVGPRPPLPDEVSRYTDYERQRLTVRPGLTCIWQVNGRSDLDFETWMQMDIDYIRTWSLGLDLRLLAKTIPAMLSRRGAY